MFSDNFRSVQSREECGLAGSALRESIDAQICVEWKKRCTLTLQKRVFNCGNLAGEKRPQRRKGRRKKWIRLRIGCPNSNAIKEQHQHSHAWNLSRKS